MSGIFALSKILYLLQDGISFHLCAQDCLFPLLFDLLLQFSCARMLLLNLLTSHWVYYIALLGGYSRVLV